MRGISTIAFPHLIRLEPDNMGNRKRFTDVQGIEGVDSFEAEVEDIPDEPMITVPREGHHLQVDGETKPMFGFGKGGRFFQWAEQALTAYLDKLEDAEAYWIHNKMGDAHLNRVNDWASLDYYTEEISPEGADYYQPVYPCKRVSTWGEMFPHRFPEWADEGEKGLPVWDWEQPNPTYYDRLGRFLRMCAKRGFVVTIDLFSPWDLKSPFYHKNVGDPPYSDGGSPYEPRYNVNYSWDIWRESYPTTAEVEAGGPFTSMRIGDTAYSIHDENGLCLWEYAAPTAQEKLGKKDYDDPDAIELDPVLDIQKAHYGRILDRCEEYQNVMINPYVYHYQPHQNDWWAQWIREHYTLPIATWDDRGPLDLAMSKREYYDMSDLSGVVHEFGKTKKLSTIPREFAEIIYGDDYWRKEAGADYRHDKIPVMIEGVPSNGFRYDGETYGEDNRYAVHQSIHKFWASILSGVSWVRYDDGPYGPGEYTTHSGASIASSTRSASMLYDRYDATQSVFLRDLGDDIWMFRQRDGRSVALWFHPNDDFAELVGADYESKKIPFSDIFSEADGWYQDKYGDKYVLPKLRENLWNKTLSMEWLEVDKEQWIEGEDRTVVGDITVTPPDMMGHWVLVCRPR